MSVTLRSDIVIDAVNATDPVKVRAAHERLTAGETARNKAAPFVNFEAMVLQNFVQAMLPDNAEEVYGKGLSGEMWQSMMAEKIAQQVARHGGIGIADRLAKDYLVQDGKKLAITGTVDVNEVVSEDQSNALAKLMLHRVQRDFAGMNEARGDKNQAAERA